MSDDRKFTLYWRDGTREIVSGRDVADAITRAGYGNGALGALDFWAAGAEITHEFAEGKWREVDR